MGLPSPVLHEGADASLVLFDWDRVTERNSYEDPLVPPDGIDAVWVHGDLVHDDGRIHPPKTFAGRHLLTPPGRLNPPRGGLCAVSPCLRPVSAHRAVGARAPLGLCAVLPCLRRVSAHKAAAANWRAG